MSYHPECWRCDHCERVVPMEELKSVPAGHSGLADVLCEACMKLFGWSDETLEAYWAGFRELLKQAK